MLKGDRVGLEGGCDKVKRGRAGERWRGLEGGRGVVTKWPRSLRGGGIPHSTPRLAEAWVGVWQWVTSV